MAKHDDDNEQGMWRAGMFFVDKSLLSMCVL